MANLRIEPSDNEIQFYLNDEMPECSVTLNEIDQRGPLIYRVRYWLFGKLASHFISSWNP
jgi:hypothetical protein